MNTSPRLLVMALLLATLPAQKGLGQGEFKEIPVHDEGFDGMVYQVFTPAGATGKKEKRYPLVFALHGNGQKAKGHVRNIAKTSSSELPVFVVAPQYQKESKFNAPVFPGAGKIFHQILARLLEEQPIDPGRVVLQGFSMGSNYATGWVNALMAGEEQDRRFPFRAVWLNGTAVPPRKPAPEVPFLLFVGEKETAVLGRINVVENVRRAYRRMFTQGLDVCYLEIPKAGHGVNRQCHQLMRDHLASFPDHSGAIPDKLGKLLPEAYESCLWGQFDQALVELDVVLRTGSTKHKGKARTARGKLLGYIKKYGNSIAKKRQPSIAEYLELVRLAEILSEHATLGRLLKTDLLRLEKNRKFSPELTAWRAFIKGQEAAGEDWEESVAALKAIADGPHKDSWYGLRARAHMQALGQDYASPYVVDPGKKRK